MNEIAVARLIRFPIVAGALLAAPYAAAKAPETVGSIELGYSAVMSHTVQFSKSGTQFNYVKNGGQDILFPFARADVTLRTSDKDRFVFLYQPLELNTRVIVRDELKVDDVTFASGTPVDFKYSFPFYRFSWLRDTWSDESTKIALGGSLQLRNARIEFTSVDGKQHRSNRNVGPVPIFKFQSRTKIEDDVWWGTDIDSIYVPVKYLNGGNSDVVGSFHDVSLKLGFPVVSWLDAAFVSRYIGGGAKGTNKTPLRGSDGFSDNQIHTINFSLALNLKN
ncbi:MAG: hypothetical protein EBR09_03075 [Proteobacteria bacterium]|nr:hypothetical protein [Pseudomonadota bacterium]